MGTLAEDEGTTQGDGTKRDFGSALRHVLRRVETTLEETGSEFPLYAQNTSDSSPKWFTTTDGNWCAGYWIGLLWLASKHCRSEESRQRYTTAAYDHLAALAEQPTRHLFAGLNHYYAGFVGFDIVGDPRLREIGIRGADAMLDLYNRDAQQIPIGDYATAPRFSRDLQSRMPLDRSYLAAVDAVHTSLPVLWRAHAETKRPEYLEVALAHTRRHVEWHIRADGSTLQMTEFDPESGTPQNTFNPLALKGTSCWSRGLAWSVAGLAQAYVSSGEEIALEAVQRSMSYYLGHVAEDLVPAWDFEHPDPKTTRDSSAAAITAYGLLLLRGRSGPETLELERLGIRILRSLIENYLVWDSTAQNTGAILHGCYRQPGNVAVDNELIWGNYYVAAALDLVG